MPGLFCFGANIMKGSVAIGDYPPFNQVSSDYMKQTLLSEFEYIEIPALNFVAEMNAPVIQIGCICSGSIDLFIENEEGRFIRQGRITSNNYFGIEALFGNGVSLFHALSIDPVKCLVIDKEKFQDIIFSNSRLRAHFENELVNRLKLAIHNQASLDHTLTKAETQVSNRKLERAIQYIDHHYARDISLDDLAEINCLSRFYLSREFKQETGYRFKDYLNMKRLNAAQKLLSLPDVNISEACFSVGFNDVSYFSRVFKKYFGVSPSIYKKQVDVEASQAS